jgi:hypothetical protein
MLELEARYKKAQSDVSELSHGAFWVNCPFKKTFRVRAMPIVYGPYRGEPGLILRPASSDDVALGIASGGNSYLVNA